MTSTQSPWYPCSRSWSIWKSDTLTATASPNRPAPPGPGPRRRSAGATFRRHDVPPARCSAGTMFRRHDVPPARRSAGAMFRRHSGPGLICDQKCQYKTAVKPPTMVSAGNAGERPVDSRQEHCTNVYSIQQGFCMPQSRNAPRFVKHTP